MKQFKKSFFTQSLIFLIILFQIVHPATVLAGKKAKKIEVADKTPLLSSDALKAETRVDINVLTQSVVTHLRAGKDESELRKLGERLENMTTKIAVLSQASSDHDPEDVAKLSDLKSEQNAALKSLLELVLREIDSNPELQARFATVASGAIIPETPEEKASSSGNSDDSNSNNENANDHDNDNDHDNKDKNRNKNGNAGHDDGLEAPTVRRSECTRKTIGSAGLICFTAICSAGAFLVTNDWAFGTMVATALSTIYVVEGNIVPIIPLPLSWSTSSQALARTGIGLVTVVPAKYLYYMLADRVLKPGSQLNMVALNSLMSLVGGVANTCAAVGILGQPAGSWPTWVGMAMNALVAALQMGYAINNPS